MDEPLGSTNEDFVLGLYAGAERKLPIRLSILINAMETEVMPGITLHKSLAREETARYNLQTSDEDIEVVLSKKGTETKVRVTPIPNWQEMIEDGSYYPFSPYPNEGRKAVAEFLVRVFTRAIEAAVDLPGSADATNAAGSDAPPVAPESPPLNSSVDLWLDWYHNMRGHGFRCTLKDVAKGSGYSLGYIKQKHAVYRASRPQNLTNS